MEDMTQEQTEPPDAGFDPQRLREAPLQMRRSVNDRYVAGVCGGFAAYARIDPVVVRVVTAALGITGPGIVLYLAAWVLTPKEGRATAAVDSYHCSGRDDIRRVGWVVAGVLAFAALISAGPRFDVWFAWPLAALAILGWLWLARDRSTATTRRPARVREHAATDRRLRQCRRSPRGAGGRDPDAPATSSVGGAATAHLPC